MAISFSISSPQTVRKSHWQRRIFAVSWISYAGFYLCRKNFSVMMPLLMQQGIPLAFLANVVFGFSAAYIVGQFATGFLADRFGPRITVASGMIISAGAVMIIGIQPVPALLLCQVVNGLAQAAGWSGLVKLMGNWFSPAKRGITMGWWSTNYIFGGFAGSVLATCAATIPWIALPSWRKAALLPAFVLLCLVIAFRLLVEDTPREAGFTPPDTDQPESRVGHVSRNSADLFLNPLVRVLLPSYSVVKMIRYTFLLWLPTYLTLHLHLGIRRAGFLSALFELAGIAGAVLAGYASDIVFQSRRFPVCAAMLAMLAVVCILQSYLSRLGIWGTPLFIALLGVATYGPDTLMVGVMAQDLSAPGNVGLTTGIVDGCGSLGQLLSPFLVSMVVARLGWQSLFHIFAAASLSVAVLLACAQRREERPEDAADDAELEAHSCDSI